MTRANGVIIGEDVQSLIEKGERKPFQEKVFRPILIFQVKNTYGGWFQCKTQLQCHPKGDLHQTSGFVYSTSNKSMAGTRIREAKNGAPDPSTITLTMPTSICSVKNRLV